MKKFGLLCLALVLALGSLGTAYAMWSEDLYINGTVNTGEVDWMFDCGTVTWGDPCDPATIDKQCDDLFANIRTTGKDVGCTNVICVDSDGDGDTDTLQVTISNAYPHYYVHVGYYACSNGTVPIHFERAVISSNGTDYTFYAIPCVVTFDADGDGDMDLDVRFGNNFGAQLHNGDCIDQSFDVHVRQPADMLDTYTFQIKLTAVQYNETLVPK